MEKRSAGFTLLEALVVVVIMAIILAAGIPAFGNLIDKTRIRTAAEEVVEAFRVARLTAVQERITMKMCPWNAADTCSGSDWDQGIMIVKGSTGEVIYRKRFNDRLFVRKNNIDGTTDEININASGWIPGDQSSIFICAEPGNIENGLRLTVSMAGKITVSNITNSGDCAS